MFYVLGTETLRTKVHDPPLDKSKEYEYLTHDNSTQSLTVHEDVHTTGDL